MFMKYNKIDLNEKLFGDDFIVYDWKDDNDTVTIYVKATSHDDICPVCVSPVHSEYANCMTTIKKINVSRIVGMSWPIG